MSTMDVLPGTGEDGADADQDDLASRLLSAVSRRQEAVWAVLSQGRIVPRVKTMTFDDPPWTDENVTGCTIYLPEQFIQWWNQDHVLCWAALREAAQEAWGIDATGANHNIAIQSILDVPAELTDFVARNIARPKPRRYNSTAVQYVERDGVTWLTPPEVKLYDLIKEAGWLFIPQPPFLAGEDIDRRPDFCIFWKGKAQNAVLIEIDSDAFHKPSQRDADERKERLFQSRGFEYIRFSAKKMLTDPMWVLRDITDFCNRKFGG